jgi:hypothetical protein
MRSLLKAPSRGPKGSPRMSKAVTVVRTYGNLPAYEVLNIVDYTHAEASCWNKQKLLLKRRRYLEYDDDKENSWAAMQRS